MDRKPETYGEGQVCTLVSMSWGARRDEVDQSTQSWACLAKMIDFTLGQRRPLVRSRMHFFFFKILFTYLRENTRMCKWSVVRGRGRSRFPAQWGFIPGP